MDDLQRKLEALWLAVHDEGRVPSSYRYTMRQHREEWPKLWRAIDDLLAEIKLERDTKTQEKAKSQRPKTTTIVVDDSERLDMFAGYGLPKDPESLVINNVFVAQGCPQDPGQPHTFDQELGYCLRCGALRR